jgi:hypothetical protein
MRPVKRIVLPLLVLAAAARAGGPCGADKRTILLLHFDEAAGEGRPRDSSVYQKQPYAGPVATGDEGVFGNAMAFTNQHLEIAHDASFATVQSNGFLECWLKPGPDMLDRWGGDQTVVGKNAGGSNRGDVSFGIRMNPNSYGGGLFQLTMETGTGTYRTLRTPNMITASRWYHVRVSWDSVNKPRIVVDGVERPFTDAGTNTDFSYAGPVFNVGVRMLVGVSGGPAGAWLLLDELRLSAAPPPTGTAMLLR